MVRKAVSRETRLRDAKAAPRGGRAGPLARFRRDRQRCGGAERTQPRHSFRQVSHEAAQAGRLLEGRFRRERLSIEFDIAAHWRSPSKNRSVLNISRRAGD